MSMLLTQPPLAFFGIGGIGTVEMVIIGIVGVLLFGKNLPDVGRSIGKSLMEFKNGLRGIESEINLTSSTAPKTSPRAKPRYHDIDDRDEATAPKFEPPPAEPQDQPAVS